MKKILALVLTFTLLILSVGCHENPPQNAGSSDDTLIKNPYVMKAWSGEFTEEKLKNAINEYRNDYSPIVPEKGGSPSVSFAADFEVESCSVARLSHVDDTDIEVELNGYLDMRPQTERNGEKVTVWIDWWYSGEDSPANDCLIWSYLVHVKDTSGNTHYYYFRVDYSAYAQ